MGDHDKKDVSKDGRNRKDFKKSSESSSEDGELSFSELKHEGERKKEGEGHSVSKFGNAELSREDKKMKEAKDMENVVKEADEVKEREKEKIKIVTRKKTKILKKKLEEHTKTKKVVKKEVIILIVNFLQKI